MNTPIFGLLAIGILGSIILAATTILLQPESVYAAISGHPLREPKAPTAISGENTYIAWWTNNTSNNNNEVMFRASTDGGQTFGDKTNLSNTTDSDSWRVEIAGEADNVIVSWWETNQTSDTPVARISTDAGQTFGPTLKLATNGTIGSEEEEEEGE